jgi:hypothetical protein
VGSVPHDRNRGDEELGYSWDRRRPRRPAVDVTEHYRKHLGQERSVLARSRKIRVLAFGDPDPDADGSVILMATVGMSAPDHCAEGRRPTELVMFAADEDAKALSQVLADLAHYPRAHETWLGWGHTVSLGRPIIEGSRLDAVLFVPPSLGKRGFASIGRGASRIDVLQALLITEAERRLCAVEGCESVEELLEQSDVSIVDLERDSVV